MTKLLSRLLCCLFLALVSARADIADQRYSNTIAQATAQLTNMMAAQDIVGASIALAESNTIVWARGFGYADREAGIPVGTGTVFRIGSVSKVFATTAVLKLVEDAGVDLDAPVTDYIPDFATLPRFTNAPPITVRMLLSHQSGLPGDILVQMFTTEPTTGFLDWLIAYLRTDYPAYAPLFVSVYCNSGFVLAEGIVRAAAGMPFTDYARANVFNRLGMQHSSFLNDSPAINDNLAHPYLGGERVPDEYISGYGTGGMLASMPDLLRYLRMVNHDGMLEGERYLQSATLAEMTAFNATNCPLNVSTLPLSGLGWDFVRYFELDYAGPAWVKSGGTIGYTAYIAALPDHHLSLAVAINSRGDDLFDLTVRTLQRAVLEKTGTHWPTNDFVPPFSPPVILPQEDIDALAGVYIAGNSLNMLTAGAGTLTWTAAADSETPTVHAGLIPRANGWFSAPDSQDFEIAVTNISNETILLSRRVSGPYQLTTLAGQRYDPAAVPDAWTARQSTIFLVDDLHPLDYIRLVTDNYTMRFSQPLNILHHASGFSNGYLDPHDESTAFVLGLSNRGPAAIQVHLTNGVERLQCGGYNFIDAAGVPALPAGATRAATLPDAGRTAWYRVPVRQGLGYTARLQSGDGCAAVVCDAEGKAVAWGAAGETINWRPSAAGVNYIGVHGNGHLIGSYAITVAVRSHGGHDFDGDGLADPAAVLGGALQTWLSATAYTRQTMNLDAAAADHVLAADCDGDGYADPVLVRPDGTWTVWLSGNGYNPATWNLGTTAGTPLLADADGDGRADPILVLDGLWYVWPSTLNYQAQGPFDFGLGAGTPIAADFDGDGRADPGMVNGHVWTVALSGSGNALRTASFALVGIPCPGDYDGDGYADPAIFNQGWHAWLSGSGYTYIGPVLPGAAGLPLP